MTEEGPPAPAFYLTRTALILWLIFRENSLDRPKSAKKSLLRHTHTSSGQPSHMFPGRESLRSVREGKAKGYVPLEGRAAIHGGGYRYVPLEGKNCDPRRRVSQWLRSPRGQVAFRLGG